VLAAEIYYKLGMFTPPWLHDHLMSNGCKICVFTTHETGNRCPYLNRVGDNGDLNCTYCLASDLPHLIRVCLSLHNLCYKCGVRGHGHPGSHERVTCQTDKKSKRNYYEKYRDFGSVTSITYCWFEPN